MNSNGKLKTSKYLVIVPVYNESANIRGVIEELRMVVPNAEVLVIDDGSTDNSAEEAKGAGAKVIELRHNLGIGGAVQTGYRFAAQLDFHGTVRLDGDGQHDPNLIFKLVEPLHNGSVDVVIGSRYLTEGGYRARGIRAIGIRVFALVVRVITGQHFTDTTSGFIATNWDASNFLANNLPSDYPEIEGLVLLCRTGFRVIEVPVKMRPRNSGKSSISHLSSAYYVAKVLLAVFIEILRKPLPKGGSN